MVWSGRLIVAPRTAVKVTLSLDETDRHVLATQLPGVRAKDWAQQVLRRELRLPYLQQMADTIAALKEDR